MLEVVTRLLSDYEDVLDNMVRTNAILLDLAPENIRERILVRGFVEIGGYGALKNATSYALEEKKLIESMKDIFCMEETAALWVVRLFGVAMGLIDAKELPAQGQDEEKIARTLSASLAGQVAIGKKHVVALCADGTIYAGGDNSEFQCDVMGWKDIIAVAAGDTHTLALRADGKVFATGSNTYDECDVSHMENVKAVYAFGNDSICVLNDGTVVSAGRSSWDLSTFSDIFADKCSSSSLSKWSIHIQQIL